MDLNSVFQRIEKSDGSQRTSLTPCASRWSWMTMSGSPMEPTEVARGLVMFRSIDKQKLVDADRYSMFCKLDESATIYQGITSQNKENISAFFLPQHSFVPSCLCLHFGKGYSILRKIQMSKHLRKEFTMLKKKVRFRTVAVAVVSVLLALILGSVLWNRVHARYEDLPEADRFILDEWNAYFQKTADQDLWEGFQLREKSILALNGSSGTGYLIQPAQPVHNPLAVKVAMPDDFAIEVYRITPLAPQLLALRPEGNFNTIGKTYTCFGSEIYFVRYDPAAAVSKPYTSAHFITYLSHEAFHYYMQEKWAAGSTYSLDGLSADSLELLYQEYEVLAELQDALREDDTDRAELLSYTRQYLSIMAQRIQRDPALLELELARETAEGTATYIGIRASQLTGYDYGVMYFDNVKDAPFSDLRNAIESGSLDAQFLANRIPYETGALLCLLLDRLEIPDWQTALNRQTPEQPVTLYDVLRSACEQPEA